MITTVIIILISWLAFGSLIAGLACLSEYEWDIYEVDWEDVSFILVSGILGVFILIPVSSMITKYLRDIKFWKKKVFHKKLNKVTNFGKAKIKVG